MQAAKEFRTSSQYFLPTTNDPILERVDERVQQLVSSAVHLLEDGAASCLFWPSQGSGRSYAPQSTA